MEDGLSEGGSRWCDSLGANNRSRFGGGHRARANEEGMKGVDESVAGMRPKKVGESFLCAWFSAVSVRIPSVSSPCPVRYLSVECSSEAH